ncbi:L,D-transpeptidase [Pararhodobacter sp. CCB-MM2]|uniref:L,D-transpeptidase n=1 Tax=Pararhodobacter sp. CCB-MM2 TaxID=1786003 RepID=UPI00082E6E54|nr:L,D-transpeptidase [Pararhodobacter sp. CCB-MM2]
MPVLTRRALLAGLAVTPLAGCVMNDEPPVFDPIDYGPRVDNGFNLPAVPIEEVPAGLRRQVVPFELEYEPGHIVIDPDQRSLYLVLRRGYALRYGIAVGREGLGWHGEAVVYNKAQWPPWTPTANMIERDPGLAEYADGQPGGPSNPLGARALYLRTLATQSDEGIRIHGTPSWQSIGRAASSGCFRMINQEVIDLYDRVEIGTRVSVI